jgi:GAF domain-containing protein
MASPRSPVPRQVGLLLGERAPSAPDDVRTIVDAVIDITQQLSPGEALARIAAQACNAVPSCHEAGLVLIRARGRLEASVATGPMATACGQLLCELGDGPVLDSVADPRPVRVADVSADDRWPALGAAFAGLGVRSLLAVPLVNSRGTSGVLLFYGTGCDAFSADEEGIAAAYAVHAGIALAHAELEANLRAGLQTREEIGRAVGILMERHRITASDAFDMLVVASQHSHRKLREVAAWMSETGEDPSKLLRVKPQADIEPG